jgi:hypothetical protein
MFCRSVPEITNIIMERFKERNKVSDSGFFPVQQFFSAEFINFLNSRGLGKIAGHREEDGSTTEMSVAFLTRAGSDGFVHSDRYDTENGPESFHVSFHINLSGTGKMVWFAPDEGIVLPEDTNDESVPYYTYSHILDQLDVCDNYLGVTLSRVDIPHRGENLAGWKPRITLTVRFSNNPTFEECVEAFNDYVLPRPQ